MTADWPFWNVAACPINIWSLIMLCVCHLLSWIAGMAWILYLGVICLVIANWVCNNKDAFSDSGNQLSFWCATCHLALTTQSGHSAALPRWQRFITWYLLLCLKGKVGGSRTFCNCNLHAETLILFPKRRWKAFRVSLYTSIIRKFLMVE